MNTPHSTRARTLLDWRMVATLIILVLVVIICWGFVQRVRQADALIETAQRSAHVIESQQDELAKQRRLSAERNRLATVERDQLLAQIRQLQGQLASLGKYLRARGVDVPKAVTRGPAPLTFSPRTSTPPAPDQPGRSDGHRAHPKK